jgi:hypothetical protein
MQFDTLLVKNAEDGALRTARSIIEAESLSAGGDVEARSDAAATG